MRALLRKHRIFIDFNAPALVIGKMPMKNIQLVKCHKVYKTFYLACPPKTATRVKHKAPVRIERLILYIHIGNGAIALQKQLL